MQKKLDIIFMAIMSYSVGAQAHNDELEHITVIGQRINLVGEAVSASEGVVGQTEIDIRPLMRTGEVLELIPGMVVTQHSGNGKANQYFLRGFNLDHGTDFRTTIDKMPVNMPTHGHGQGYTDINFIIPELIDSISYKKGPYYAEVGDFSGAGAAEFVTMSELKQGLSHLTIGQNQYQRLLIADSLALDNGSMIMALETNRYDGPWSTVNEDLGKVNFYARRHWHLSNGTDFSLSLMSYDNNWNSADQIPQRAVDQGLIDRLGSIDNTVSGESNRNSLSTRWQNQNWDISTYAIRYELDLWSNFTYLLNDPLQGDQFLQVDQRLIYGNDSAYRFTSNWGNLPIEHVIGLQLRYDDIGEVGLHKTRAQQRIETVRSDAVKEASTAIYWGSELLFSEKLRGIISARYDYYRFKVNSNIAQNSGDVSDGIASVKFNLSYKLNSLWELYTGIGQGFHSNDARGVTLQIDPLSGTPAQHVDPLVRSKGSEIGLRFYGPGSLNASLAIWSLELDSELLFVGDAGNTEASRGSRRYGAEFTAYYQFNDYWVADFEYAYSNSRFSTDDPFAAEGNYIEGSLPRVISAGINVSLPKGWYGNLRMRYFSERALDSFNITKSDSSTIWNVSSGYRWAHFKLELDMLNLLDSKDHDIDYLYASRLPGEPAEGVEDIHFHPIEPRTARLSFKYQF